MTTLQEQIRIVAEARKKAEVKFQARHSALTAWQEAHKDLYDEEGTANLEQTRAEQTLRDMTIEAYKATGNKTPVPGVAIRETIEIKYEPKTALDWAVKHNIALQLDVRAFEKIAKASPPEFVELVVIPKATIATDLNKVLKEYAQPEEQT